MGDASGAVGRALADPRLRCWVVAMLARPGLTAFRDPEAAWEQHVVDSLAAVPLLEALSGRLVDVGSGGGAPGIPLAAAFPEREVTLLEANGRKCDFLRAVASGFPNVRVVHGRAEAQEVDSWVAVVAKALAPPPTAAEWCLPLVRPGGAAVLFAAGDADTDAVSRVSERLGGGAAETHSAGAQRVMLVLRKLGTTPAGFPRRPGMARKRPLA
ncbi:MAG: 16S rRNA (guanine(527)-N(7))-methyltransferase RsmG [Gaiellaceae bacterium]